MKIKIEAEIEIDDNNKTYCGVSCMFEDTNEYEPISGCILFGEELKIKDERNIRCKKCKDKYKVE